MPGKSSFQELWLHDPDYKDWILENKDDKYTAKCGVCLKTIELASMGASALKSHMDRPKHKLRMESRKASSNISNFFSKPILSQPADNSSVGVSRVVQENIDSFAIKSDTLDAEIIWALKCQKNHYSFKSCDDISIIFRKMFPDSAIAKQFSCGERKCSYICNFGLAPYIKSLLLKSCECAENFTLLFDETLNQSNQKKQLDIHVRYWNRELKKVSTQYLTSAFIGHSTSEDLLTNFYESVKNLDLSKLLSVSMDGPAVNWKFYELLQNDLETQFNFQCVNIGSCGLHILNNAFKHGMSCIEWDVPSVLTALYYIFKDSPARREDFLSVSQSKKFPKKFCNYRWLENVPAAERANEIWNDIISYVNKVNEGKFTKISSKSFQTVKEAVLDGHFLIKLNHFLSVAKVIFPFLELYQNDGPLLPFFAQDLYDLIINLLTHFKVMKDEKISSLTLINVCKFDFDDPNIYNEKSNVSLGFTADQIIKEKKKKKELSTADFFSLKKEAQMCIFKIIRKLLQKAPINYMLVRNASCFDPRLMAQDPQKAREKLKNVLIVLSQVNRVDKKDCDQILLLFSEFLEKVVKDNNYDFTSFEPRKTALDDFLSIYFSADTHYEKIWRVAKMVMILSHGQASVERGFSINKSIEVENLSEMSYISQRSIYDFLKFSNGIENVHITKEMRKYVAGAHSKYIEYLEEQKNKNKNEGITKKRKALEEEISFIKRKKKVLENDITDSTKKADSLSQEAEDKRNLDLFIKCNELRKSVKEKQTDINALNLQLTEKEKELKNM